MHRRIVSVAVGICLGVLGGLWLFAERGRLMTRSTRNLLREMGWRRLFSVEFWHTYIYVRWTNQYIGWAIHHVFPRVKPVEGERYWADSHRVAAFAAQEQPRKEMRVPK